MIEIQKITKIYGSGAEEVRALDGIETDIERGELLGLVGPSGSGKTSLLNILGCLDRPSSGTVRVGGRDLFALSDTDLTRFRASSLGFIFQSFNLFDLLTAGENVEYPLHLNRVPSSERRRRAGEALQRVGLGGKVGRRPDQLSGGEKQRVAIARALVHEPELVLADEPTANLDSETGERIIDLLRELNRELGVTFVIATHDPALISRVGRILSIRDGHLVEGKS
jgi:putative ABC transport system ATP-binding protein